jgi:tetratricopeptide (TPR) repeat protein
LDDDIDGAIALYRDSREIAVRTTNVGGQMLCMTNLGQARIKLSEYPTAIDDLNRVIQMAEKTEWYGISQTFRLLAEAYLGEGRVSEALEPAVQALNWGRAVENQSFIGQAWLTLGKVAARSVTSLVVDNAAHDASSCFANSVQAFKTIGARAERGHALLVWAKYELEQGDRQQGESMWQRGTRILTQLGIRQPTLEEI